MSNLQALEMLTKLTKSESSSAQSQVPPAGAEANPALPGTEETTEQLEPKDESATSRLAIFAKKEAQILKDREALKKEREEFMALKKEADDIRTKGRDFDELRKKDVVAALKAIGITETEIVNFMSAQESKEPSAEEVARRVAGEEAQKIRDELKKEREELESKNQADLIQSLKTEISTKISSDPDRFEYCAFEGARAESDAYDLIVQRLQESGGKELLTTEQALDIVEELYMERDKAMAALKKRQPKPEETPSQVETPVKSQASVGNKPNAPAKSRTLTNQVTTTATSAIPRRESPAEKKQRLINALKNGGA